MDPWDLAPLFIVLVIVIAVAFKLTRVLQKKNKSVPLIQMQLAWYRSTPIFYFVKHRMLRIPYGTLIISAALVYFFVNQAKEPPIIQSLIRTEQEQGFLQMKVDVLDQFCASPFKNDLPVVCVPGANPIANLRAALKAHSDVSVSDYQFLNTNLEILNSYLRNNIKVAMDIPALKALGDSKFDSDAWHVRALKERGDLAGENLNVVSLMRAQFSHANTSHITNNLIALIIFGSVVEMWLGTLNFLIVYFIGGTFGLLIYVKFLTPPSMVVLGASANITAIIAAYGVLRLKILKRIHDGQAIGGAAVMIWEGIYIAYYLFGQDVSGALHNSPGVAYGAHILGAIVGLIATLIIVDKKADDRIQPVTATKGVA